MNLRELRESMQGQSSKFGQGLPKKWMMLATFNGGTDNEFSKMHLVTAVTHEEANKRLERFYQRREEGFTSKDYKMHPYDKLSIDNRGEATHPCYYEDEDMGTEIK